MPFLQHVYGALQANKVTGRVPPVAFNIQALFVSCKVQLLIHLILAVKLFQYLAQLFSINLVVDMSGFGLFLYFFLNNYGIT